MSEAWFVENKYWRWYVALCGRARERKLSQGCEKHHVQPKSLGGTDVVANLVSLTFREHFLAHWLLIKCTTGAAKRKMSLALWAMTRVRDGRRIVAGWQYKRAREAHYEAVIGRIVLPETRQRIRLVKQNPTEQTREKLRQAARNRSPEWRAKIAASNRSREVTDEARANMRAANLRRPHRPEHSAKLMGHEVSAETRAKMSAARISYWARKRKASGQLDLL